MRYSFDRFELDTELFELEERGIPVPMEPQVFEVLAYLVANYARVVTKEELLDHVWPERYVSEAALNSRVMAARKAVGDNGRDQAVIRTVHGRGYRFVATVAELRPASSKPRLDRAPQSPDPIPAKEPISLAGRESDLGFLRSAWERACTGRRQTVFISGEPGIGKSTLVSAFIDEARRARRLRCALGQCVELSGPGEAYLPVFDALARLTRSGSDTAVVSQLARLAPGWLAQMPGLVDDELFAFTRMQTLGANRDRMVGEFLALIDGLAVEVPLVIALEDLHWSDPSSIDLIAALARRTEPAHLLVLATYRPGSESSDHVLRVQRDLRLHGQAAHLALGRLDASAVASMLSFRFPGVDVPASIAARLRDQAGGNPLFVNALVEHLQEAGILRETGSALHAEPGQLTAAVPPALHDLVTAEYFRVSGFERDVLAAGALAGVEFSADTVAYALGSALDVVENTCAGLAQRNAFVRTAPADTKGTIPRFGFLHHLYRQSIIDALPRPRRERLHHALGKALERLLGSAALERAAELALHFEGGGDPEKSVKYRLAAARVAFSRSGYFEAETHLTAALRTLESNPLMPLATRLEMEVNAALGPTLVSMHGFGVQQAEVAWRRTKELASALGDDEHLAGAVFGLVTLLEYRGAHESAASLLEQFAGPGLPSDAEVAVPFHALLSCSTFHRGDFKDSVEFGARGLRDARAEPDPRWAVFGEEPANGCREWSALALWFLGYPDSAVARIGDAIRDAEQPGRRYALASATTHAARVHQLRREPRKAEEHARRVIELATAHGFGYHRSVGRILLGWALAAQGLPDGLRLLQEGIDEHGATGAAMDRPYFLALFAEQLFNAGHRPEASAALTRACAELRDDQFFYRAEIRRLQGRLATDFESANHHYLAALETARAQDAKSLELRAAVSIARNRYSADPEAASNLIAPIMARFEEGLDTPDMAEAKALLSRSPV